MLRYLELHPQVDGLQPPCRPGASPATGEAREKDDLIFGCLCWTSLQFLFEIIFLSFQGNKFFSFLRWMCGTRSSSPGSLMVSQCINPSVQAVPTPSQWLPGMWRQCLGWFGDDWLGCGMERGAIQFDSSLQFHSCNCENLSITCQSSITQVNNNPFEYWLAHDDPRCMALKETIH